MEHYRKLVNQLTGELGMHEQADGFPSAELRGRILLRLADLRLSADKTKQKNHPQMDAEANRRLDYLMQARKIGTEVTQAFAREEFAMLSSHYLFGGILAGAELIGREIAREYAIALYPVIKRLYDEHIELPVSEPAKGKTEFQKVFAFTVKTHPYFIDVGKIEEIMSDVTCRILHGEQEESYCETFMFHTREEAEEKRKQWLRYRDGQSKSSPARYGVQVETAAEGTVTIGEIRHLAPDEKPEILHHDNGGVSELHTFDCLEDAIKYRQELEGRIIYDSADQDMNLDGEPGTFLPGEIPFSENLEMTVVPNQEVKQAGHAFGK